LWIRVTAQLSGAIYYALELESPGTERRAEGCTNRDH
jgi:hypothetical protein